MSYRQCQGYHGPLGISWTIKWCGHVARPELNLELFAIIWQVFYGNSLTEEYVSCAS